MVTAISSSSLLNYYASQINMSLVRSLSSSTASSTSSSDATSSDVAPWDEDDDESTIARDAEVLSMTDYVDTSNVPASAVGDDGRLEQDNQKLFSIYNALDTLQYLAEMAGRDDVEDGVIAGYNSRFQDCLSQIEDYISSVTFNNLELQQAAVDSIATALAAISTTTYGYTGNNISDTDSLNDDVEGVSTSDSFTISITKNGTTTDLEIDMADVESTYGSLSISNIAAYINSQLEAAGYSTRFSREKTDSTTDDDGNTVYNYALGITSGTGETITLSASADESSEALYLSGTSGLTTSSDDTDANNAGRLVKLSLSGTDDTTTSVFSVTQDSDGLTTAVKSVTDDDGNTYVIGTSDDDVDGEINQGTQDVYVSKYDSAGNLLWSHLIGSSDDADAYDIALDPTGGVVVVGSTTSDLVYGSVADGNTDSFVAKFDDDGTESWVTQLSTTKTNAAYTVAVADDGSVTIGGYVSGALSGQTASGGKDAYLISLDSSGSITATQQYGTSGSDSVEAMTYDDDGNLYVVTVEDGEAYVSKYTADADGNVDISGDATWTQDLGTVGSGGDISDILVDSSGNVYVAGSVNSTSSLASADTVNGSLSGNTDAFVYKLTQATDGSSADLSTLTYVGTSGQETSGSMAISSDGTLYLTGSTTGTFDGQTRNAEGTYNAYITAIDTSDGSVDWTKQYGGTSGQSTGASVAIVEDNSSVLDALGLPTGTVTTSNYTSLLTDQTTLKAGDSFTIDVSNGSSTRSVTISIDADETLSSLVLKINNKLGDAGTASVSYSSGSKTLKLESSSGYALTLSSDDTDSDALAGLGLDEITLTDGSVTVTEDSKTKTVYGLGLDSDMSFSTKSEANAVKATIGNVLSTIESIYSSINSTDDDSDSSTSSTTTTSTSYVNYLTSKSTSGQIALSILA